MQERSISGWFERIFNDFALPSFLARSQRDLLAAFTISTVVSNIRYKHGLLPVPERKCTTTWADFIRTHRVLLAGTDFFAAEVLTLRELVTYYVLIHSSRESPSGDRGDHGSSQ